MKLAIKNLFNLCTNSQILNGKFIYKESYLQCIKKISTTSQNQIRNRKKPKVELTFSQLDYIEKLQSGEKKSSTNTTKDLLDNATTFEGEKGANSADVWHSNPYKNAPKEAKRQLQGSYLLAPKLNPNKTSVVLFPGQGTQFVGMSKQYLEIGPVRDLYDAASEVLGYDLLKLTLEGPASQLDQTEFQQPAIFVASLAAVEKLRHKYPEALEHCIASAGFSLGELTALTFAGAFSFETALRLVKIRAEAMQIASEMNSSGMMSVFYGPEAKIGFACHVALKYCKKLEMEDVDCRIASYMYPSCKVVAGNTEALNFIEKNKVELKIKKIKRLNVSGAFHTNLMKPAAEVFREALENVSVSKPHIPVYSTVDGKRYKTKGQIIGQLPKQICRPVVWEQLMHVLYEKPAGSEFPLTYICGPGKSLKTMLKFINAKAELKCLCI